MHTESSEPVGHTAYDSIQESGGIMEYRLRANGLQVLVLRESSAPVVAFMVTYRVGSRNEGPGLSGATHFLEHLMFKGSRNFNRENGRTVFSVLQSIGARVNATTWLDRTNYYELLPREHLPLAAEIEADRMRGALLAEADVESERTVILNELDRGENEPIRKLYQSVWSTAFVAHPYRHPTIGWRSDVERTTADGLREFYDTFYRPDNATVSVIGDVDPSEALDVILRYFGGIEAAPEEIPDVHTIEPEQEGERRVVVRRPGQLGVVMVAWKQPSALDPESDALDVLSVVLSEGKASRLHRRLVDRGLVTSVHVGTSDLRNPGLMYVLAPLVPGAEHEQVEAEIRDEIAAIVRVGITEQELARAQSQIRSAQLFSRDGPFAIATELNEAIAAGDWRLYTTALTRALQVTVSDVQSVAERYCIRDHETVGFFVPRDGRGGGERPDDVGSP